MYAYMAILGVFVFVYSVLAGRIESTPISGPIIYTIFGLGLSIFATDLEPLAPTGETIKTLAELSLALVLFTDAATADLAVLRRSFRIPQRLLLYGLPLTILLGFLAAIPLFPGLGFLEAAILATMLAPTDAALGKAVVTNDDVPDTIRDGLNLESGLNDGICVPILFVFLAMIADEQARNSVFGLALQLVLEEIGIGVAVGVGLAVLSSHIIRYCSKHGFITETWRQLPVVALSISCFALAQLFGGSGFIAAFVGGLVFGGVTKEHKHHLLLAAEGSGDTMALITWVFFGYAIIGHDGLSFTWPMFVYAILSLTVIRMAPVFLVLSGLNLSPHAKLFMGWFGPRGLASVVFAVLILDGKLPHGQTIVLTAILTICLSILTHGLTAVPLSRAFGREGDSASG
ncbi:cation:proton antiporter [Desulfovibrio inopinatus]|uniref:cation:proton antiporter n=1 Tax=Desulfovibrio inopinatus TaxID=102109 RepID=UPI00041C442C|nr:cation:proton antiporter [Desulfovibrio inopinatus]